MRIFVGLCLALYLLTPTHAVSPPAQPSSGPGSNVYEYSDVVQSEYGKGNLKYWIYEPVGYKQELAPVLLYLHGWAADEPIFYEEMIKHFAKKGFIVVFPKYGHWFNIGSYEENAKKAFENALVQLQTGKHLKPDLNRVIFSGHSLGSQIASRMADTAANFNYPAPKALVLHEPAGTSQLKNNFAINNNMKNVSKDTFLMIIVRDDWAEDPGGYPVPATIWHSTKHLSNRIILRIPNDNSQQRGLVSHHSSMQTGGKHFWEDENTHGVDAIDTWGYWRSSEAAINFALYGKDKEYVMGEGDELKDMGSWSNGKSVNKKHPVKEAVMRHLYNHSEW